MKPVHPPRNETRKPDSRERVIGRRQFLKSSAFVGGSALAGLAGCTGLEPEKERVRAVGKYILANPENVLYTTCLQCHVDCQVKAKVWDGVLAKLTGSPYSPQNYLPHLHYETDLPTAALADGKLCAKGQSGIQTYYDPYRLRKVLKRNGPRGANQWVSIPFDQFIDEVTKGGTLFADCGENRRVPGFSDVYVMRDRALAKRMAADACQVGKGEVTLEAFKAKYADSLDQLIDPERPDLGPKNNGFVFAAGRIEHGRKELMKWFTHAGIGSANAFEHTTICEQSHHIAYNEITGGTHHLKPDLTNAEFVIFWGTGAFTANFGLTPMAEKVTTGKRTGRMRTAVVDPRLSNDAAKADWWVPIKPGADGALALWMIRWIIENKRYDARYLANANRAAAAADGETTWTNGTHLVKIVDGHATELLTPAEAGLPGKGSAVVSKDGRLVAVDPEDTSHAIEGDLFVTTKVKGTPVKSALQLLREEAFFRTPREYEEITGAPSRQVAATTRELTSHGKRAGVELYRGPVQHTDGFYAGAAIITLNMLIGNPDWKGGLAKGGGHWHESGGKKGSVYDFKSLHPAPFPTFGPPITREKSRYEDFTFFREDGYPAKRPWYPFTSNVYQEIIPSFAQGYPYPGKILFLHKGTPALAAPAGHKVIEMLCDPERVPLFIACDIVIGETSMYADYILPDLTYLERWGAPHVTPDVVTKTSKVRQPVAAPLTEEVIVDGETMPLSLEAFLIAVAKKLGLPGFGKDALNPGMNFDRSEDWYLKLVANIACGDNPDERVPAADEKEMQFFRKARKHLPPSVFDENRWRRAVRAEEWERVVYVLNRGGRFAPFESACDGEHMHGKLGKMVHLFMENVAAQNNSISGKPFSGVPVYRGQFDAAGKALDRGGDYPLALITYKDPFSGHSRTISNYWGNISLKPENKVLVNRVDAQRLGLRHNQRVRLVSASNPEGRVDLGNGSAKDIVAPLEVVEGIRPGTVALSWHYGHWAYGSNEVAVDGIQVPGDRRRAKGACPNPLMAVDPILKDVCLTDPIGGSASFSDTRVKLVPV